MSPRELRVTGRALPSQARTHNRAAVLQHLFHHGPCSRAELSRTTGLTRVTVSALVEDLISEGLTAELGTENPTGRVGKRAILVGLAEDRWQIVALDLTNDGAISGAVLTLSGQVVHRRTGRRPLPQGEAGVETLTAFARTLLALADQQVLGVGVSSPGVITPEGLVEQAPNLGWFDLPLAGILTRSLGLPVLVANDANCAALAEYSFGGAAGGNLLRLHIGVGLGSGLVLDGALLQGAGNAAGEVGHVTAVDDRDTEQTLLGPPKPCACGRRGCLETILSAPALREDLRGLDEQRSAEHLRAVGRRLGTVLAPVVSTLDLTELIVSGQDHLVAGDLLESASGTIRERILPRSTRSFVMRMSTLGADGALRGAAVLVLSGRLGIA
ncbi:ROK family transcriptional regulator [Actinomyces provencensis]|uniref:ROK family transcriptional regulator n=1 Tax=Actinomyces provencensis TaxID=1720198 RepID=UPI00096AB502|nr:ROK family transcriptional regulator [Actinomyces provencensis]